MTHSTASQSYTFGKHKVKFPLKVLKIKILQELRLLSEGYFSGAFKKLYEKMPKLFFPSAKAHAIPNLGYVVSLSMVGKFNSHPCLDGIMKMEHNLQITKQDCIKETTDMVTTFLLL